MLGSLTEADDAAKQTWLRLARTDTSDVEKHSVVVRGSHAVAGRAAMFASSERTIVAADVNGTPVW